MFFWVLEAFTSVLASQHSIHSDIGIGLVQGKLASLM